MENITLSLIGLLEGERGEKGERERERGYERHPNGKHHQLERCTGAEGGGGAKEKR